MRKVKALSRLAGGNPRGCNVGIILEDKAVAKAAALFAEFMEGRSMNVEHQNVYVVEVEMKNKSVEDIARDAALQIMGITDALLERQKQAEVAQREEQDG